MFGYLIKKKKTDRAKTVFLQNLQKLCVHGCVHVLCQGPHKDKHKFAYECFF